MDILKSYKIFDSHFHIIEQNFPLIPNQGYLRVIETLDDKIAEQIFTPTRLTSII